MRDIASRIRSVDDAEHLARRRLPKALAQLIEVGDPTPTFGRNLAAPSGARRFGAAGGMA